MVEKERNVLGIVDGQEGSGGLAWNSLVSKHKPALVVLGEADREGVGNQALSGKLAGEGFGGVSKAHQTINGSGGNEIASLLSSTPACMNSLIQSMNWEMFLQVNIQEHHWNCEQTIRSGGVAKLLKTLAE